MTVFGTIIRGVAWLPFLIYGFLQMAVLIILANYTNPFIYPVLSPLVGYMVDENASMFNHYPTLYLLLPYVYQWFKIAVGIIFEGLVAGMTVVLLMGIINGKNKTGPTLKAAFNKWPQLLIVWTLMTAILWSIDMYLPGVFEGMLAESPRRQMAFNIVLKLFTVGIYSILMYSIPALILYKNGLLESLKTSFRLFIKYPFFSFLLALVPIIITLPASYGISNANVIVDKFSPELVFYILSAGLLLEFVANYFLTATLVKFMIDEKA